METSATRERLRLIAAHREEIDQVLSAHGAVRPRLFGSTARGEARPESDIDILVDLDDRPGSALFRIAGASEELSNLLHMRVDVVTPRILRRGVSDQAQLEAVPL